MKYKILIACAFLLVLNISLVHAATLQKTVGYFVFLENNTKGSNAIATGNVTITIPESNIVVKNAWVEIEMYDAHTSTANGTVSIYLNSTLLDGTTTTVWSDKEGQEHRVLANATLLYGLTTGTHIFNVSARMTTHSVNQMMSARLFMTYDYNSSSDIQQKTIRFYINRSAANIAASTNKQDNFTINLPENQVSVKSAWFVITGITDGGGSTGNVSLYLNDSYVDSGREIRLSGTGETEGYLIIANANSTAASLYNLSGDNPSSDFAMRFDPLANEVAGYSSMLAITYTYNASSSDTLLNTVEYFIESSSENALISQTESSMSGNFKVRLPESSPSVVSSWVQVGGFSDNGASNLLMNISMNGTLLNVADIGLMGSTKSTDEISSFAFLIDTINSPISPYNIIDNENYDFDINVTCWVDACFGTYAKAFITYTYDKPSTSEYLTTNTYWIANRNLMLGTNSIFRQNFTIRVPFNTTVQSAYIETSFQNEDDVDTVLTVGINRTPFNNGNNFVDSTALVFDIVTVKRANATAASLYNISRENTNYKFEFVFNNSAENSFRIGAKAVVTYNYSVPLQLVDTCTPTADQDWSLNCANNCIITGQNYAVKLINVTGAGIIRVENSNISYTGLNFGRKSSCSLAFSFTPTSSFIMIPT